MLFDTHAHLDHELFDEDREAMIQRAFDEGIGSIVTIGTDPASSRKAIALTERYKTVYAAVGLHPTEAHRCTPVILDELAELARHPKVVAIGETGMDFYWKDSTPDQQEALFRSMIRLACSLGKPVIIHNREASEDVVRILKDEKSKEGQTGLYGVMHCFSGDLELLGSSLALDFYISFSGNVTYKKSLLPALIPQIPRDRILVETDAPFLPPVPFRGKRNESSYVRFSAQKVAEVLGISLDELEQLTTANARRMFKIS